MVENGALALISLDGKMAVDFPGTDLQAGDRVRVERADGSRIDGSIEKTVGDTVTVLVSDNGPELDEQGRIWNREEDRELGSGTLYIHSLFRVTGFTGTVSAVPSRENQQVYAASTICNLTDTGYSSRYNSILKERKEKEKTLLELLGLYQGGALRAPFDGTVLKVDYDEDSTTSAGTTAASALQSGSGAYSAYTGMSTAASSANTGAAVSGEEVDGVAVVTLSPDVNMRVNIAVDEADILSLEKGQLAEVTIESVGESTINGIVTDVDRTANSSSGVTTYTAEITFAKGNGMLSGMSADVVINIQGSENVLIVPADAIQKTSAGAFVYTEYDEEMKRFGGIVPVEVGISNDEYAEIRRGIEEGTTVFYKKKEENNFFMMMGGPGMGNGRPGGFRR